MEAAGVHVIKEVRKVLLLLLLLSQFSRLRLCVIP